MNEEERRKKELRFCYEALYEACKDVIFDIDRIVYWTGRITMAKEELAACVGEMEKKGERNE